MEKFTCDQFFNLENTITKKLFENSKNIWELLSEIHNFILKLGPTLSANDFNKISPDIWIAKTAKIANTANLNGPLIVDENAEIRHCAYIRGNVIVGKNSVVGNSTEIKNSILFDFVQVPHFNYIGDSFLGYKSHMGAGSITSNIKSDRSTVKVLYNNTKIDTNLKKFGAILSDNVEIGCNSVLNPGTIIGKNSIIYPLSSVRGIIPPNSIYKSRDSIVKKTR